MEWTDDMRVRLADGRSNRELVQWLRAAQQRGASRRELLTVLTERFALTFDDARLAMDRVEGGFVRGATKNPANGPDRIKDPLAWTAYRIALGLPVPEDEPWPPAEVTRSAQAHIDAARRQGRTRGTEDVALALEVVRLAVASQEPDRTRGFLLLEAATCLSVAAEARIARIGEGRCADPGSQDWVDGVALASGARQVTAMFAAQPDPELEQRSLALVGRIVTQLLGHCHAFVGRTMLDYAHCLQRRGDPLGAADHLDAVLRDFAVLLEWFAIDPPFDEHVLALEHLLAAVDLITEVKGRSAERDELRDRTAAALGRAEPL